MKGNAMSFSSDTKNEIASLPITGDCCAKAELLAVICFCGRLRGDALVMSTENPRVAKRVYELVKYAFGIAASLDLQRAPLCQVRLLGEDTVLAVLRGVGLLAPDAGLQTLVHFHVEADKLKRSCCKKSFLRGAFLTAGSLIHPEKHYHLEFVTHHYVLSRDFDSILRGMEFAPKTIVRKSNYVLYFKNSEEIADLLAAIGAYHTLMEYHNVRIVKEVRNNVNRQVNCETANVEKTVSASMRQIESIKKLEKRGMLDSLPQNLKDIAILRLNNPELSLTELGQLLHPPISKSGVNHRLRKLAALAQQLS